MLGIDTFILSDFVGELLVHVERSSSQPTAEQRALALRAFSQLRFGVESGEPRAIETVQRLLATLVGDSRFRPRLPGPSLGDESFVRDLLRQVEDEFARGRLVVEDRSIASLTDRRAFDIPDLPPLPPAPRDSNTHTFEVRFVDEIGKAISGIDAEFTADGPQTRATNAAGIALLEGVDATSASVEILDVEALSNALDPRWENLRPGKPPKESNTQEVVFRGGELGPFPLRGEVPNTVVIKPPLGQLFVELRDKTGRVLHANRTFEITGPQAFEGTTDDEGRLQQADVFPGDYSISLALDFFEDDADHQIDIVDSALVVLDPAESTPQVRLIGAVPRSVLARLNMFFNTNKTFVLPTALNGMQKLRRLYAENAPCQLLVVGHADTRGGPAYNDKLSLERAEATIAYLKDDVEGWFKFYSDPEPKKRWGKVEDHLMIIAMPDFDTKPQAEAQVDWFQRTRNLDVDGEAGKDTRHALIAEYMSLDGTSLSDFVGEIDAIAHGCGENFPLDDTGEELDVAPADEKRDPIDRRVELYFFDPEFGVSPPPPAPNSKPASIEYPLWRKRVTQTVELSPGDPDAPKVVFAELEDGHFRTDSAVVLPEGEDPDNSGAHQALSSVGVIAAALRFNDEHAGRSVFVAGHTDTAAGDDLNDELSRQRAKVALALLEGDRGSFGQLANARHKPKDINQILSWISEAFAPLNFGCKPAAISDFVSDKDVRNFQRDFNANKAALGSTAANLDVDGSIGELTWGAFFDCYEFALQQELGETAAAVTALRAKLKFTDPNRKSLGFGERFPIEELGVDEFRSQTNRRVEILFFEPGEEPDLAEAEADPETSDLYLPGHFERTPLEPMLSAKPFRATWDVPTAQLEVPRQMVVSAPGVPAGAPFQFTVIQDGFGPIAKVPATSTANVIVASFVDWYAPDAVKSVGILQAGQPFPVVTFSFQVDGGGRSVTTQASVTYSDRLNLVLTVGDANTVIADAEYLLCTPSGTRAGVTDAQGILNETGLSPGGASLVLRKHTLADFDVVDVNWDAHV